MSQANSFHFATVGMSPRLVRNLWDRIAAKGHYKIAHIVHPTYDRHSWAAQTTAADEYFFREDIRMHMPPPDRELLASLECEGVPTVHNMILGDRIVAQLAYDDALAYATFLTRRLMTLYREITPSLIIGDFDALHGSLAFAVAKRMNIPWFALNFSPIPDGYVALCVAPSPASMITFNSRPKDERWATAEKLLKDFEARRVRPTAYLPPDLLSPIGVFKSIPIHLENLHRTLSRRRLKRFLKYTDHASAYSISSLFREAFRVRKNLWHLRRRSLLETPTGRRYALFGLHMQPESSIDVWAHFFSNQRHVIELISRSLPPTHTLLIKLHKSDTPNYSRARLASLRNFPGVELVSPHADTYECIKNAELIFSIMGTIGLESALLGKPVIMFGDSPTKIFPSVSTIGKTTDLPALVRQKLKERKPSRTEIVEAFTSYLAPFHPGSSNDWGTAPTDLQIDGYVQLFESLKEHLERQPN